MILYQPTIVHKLYHLAWCCQEKCMRTDEHNSADLTFLSLRANNWVIDYDTDLGFQV